jgi:hypothetical protein
MEATEQQTEAAAEPAHEGPAMEEILASEDEEPEEPAAEAEPEPDWRADADAALADE